MSLRDSARGACSDVDRRLARTMTGAALVKAAASACGSDPEVALNAELQAELVEMYTGGPGRALGRSGPRTWGYAEVTTMIIDGDSYRQRSPAEQRPHLTRTGWTCRCLEGHESARLLVRHSLDLDVRKSADQDCTATVRDQEPISLGGQLIGALGRAMSAYQHGVGALVRRPTASGLRPTGRFGTLILRLRHRPGSADDARV